MVLLVSRSCHQGCGFSIQPSLLIFSPIANNGQRNDPTSWPCNNPLSSQTLISRQRLCPCLSVRVRIKPTILLRHTHRALRFMRTALRLRVTKHETSSLWLSLRKASKAPLYASKLGATSAQAYGPLTGV